MCVIESGGCWACKHVAHNHSRPVAAITSHSHNNGNPSNKTRRVGNRRSQWRRVHHKCPGSSPHATTHTKTCARARTLARTAITRKPTNQCVLSECVCDRQWWALGIHACRPTTVYQLWRPTSHFPNGNPSNKMCVGNHRTQWRHVHQKWPGSYHHMPPPHTKRVRGTLARCNHT